MVSMSTFRYFAGAAAQAAHRSGSFPGLSAIPDIPAAVPSAFTAQRQDIDEIYSRIAAEAPANEDAAERRQLRKEISSKLAEVTRAGVGLVTRVPGRARRAVLRRMGREAAA